MQKLKGLISQRAERDAELLRNIQQGIHIDESLEELITAYTTPLEKFVERLGCPPKDIPDVIQEVFSSVLQQAYTYRGEAAVGTWIFGIARNATHSAHIKIVGKYTPRKFIPLESDENLLERLAANNEAPMDKMVREEKARQLREAIDELSPIQRSVCLLRMEEKSYGEIAEALGIPVKDAYIAFENARRALQGKLDPRLKRSRSEDAALAEKPTPYLTADEEAKLLEMYSRGMRQKDIADATGLPLRTVRDATPHIVALLKEKSRAPQR